WVLVLLLVKSGVLILLGKFFKMKLDQNLVFSFSISQVGEFAFVLFAFTLQQGILTPDTVSLMIAIVATSMALTPLVLLVNEKLILPRLIMEEFEDRPADAIDEKNPVIIAGFGHFGNTVGRLLRAHKIGATYLDLDSDRVELLR